MADVIILNNAYCEAIYESHGITSNKTLYFEEFSDCGSSIEVYMCGDCGKITEVISMDGVKCDVEYDQDSGTYEDGRMYEIYTMTCKDCGLVFVDKRVTKQINACEYEYYREMTISKGITLIYSCIMEDSVSEHEYEVTYEKLGETCEDGVKITKKCSICGDEFSRELKGHEETSEHYIYFKNYGCCGGELVVDKCNVCGKIVHVRGDSPQCELYETERRTYLDDNNIEHTVIVYNCKLCGLQREEDSYIFEIDGCYITNSVNVNYTLDGEVIFEYSDLMPDDNHNLLEEYIDDDNNCENGYTIKISCSNCDYSYNILGFGHKYEKEEITSEDKDCCHFSIIYEMCAVCHKEQYNEGFEMNFECKFIEKEESYEDEFGNMHYTLTSTCEKCGLVMITEHYSNQVSSCRIDFYSSLVIIFNGEELFNKEFVFVEENHNYKTTYFVEDGMTCEDGYTIIMICEDCGDQIREPGWGHAHQMVEEFFTKDGTCGITICISKCAICGEINNVNIENIRLECMPENQSDFEAKEVVDDNGVTHSVIEFTCVNCGRTYYVDTWVNPLYDCCYEYNQLIRITDNDEVVFENTTSYEREQHDLEIEYKFYGEESDCNLGYDVFEKCKHCDYENNYSNFGHKEICTEINLSDYGLCGGIIYKVECEVCEKILSQNINEYGCCWINIESIENKDIYMCEFCKTYKSEERIVGEKDNNCSYIITHKTTYYLEDGTVLLVIESYETRYEHNYNYRVELNGSSCTDGGIVYYHCENCGHEYEREIYNHETIMETKYSLNDYENICGGDVTVYRCACGDLGKVDSEKLLCNFCHYDSYGNSDENGIWHEYSMYMCNNCGLMRIDDYFNIENGCTTYRYNNVKFVLMSEDGNEQILFEIELVEDIYYNHNYKATDVELFGETCHDGYIVYQTCVHCGESVEYESWNHENFEFVLVDLKEIGACCGYVLKYACPCELTNDINLNLNCNYNENAYEKVIDDVKYNISEITCEHCGLYIEIISYTTVNGCTAFDTKTINVVVNDVSVYSTTVQSSEYAYHDIEYTYILNGETCDDGYQIIETCKNCDYYETREGSGHETHKRISYNL
ncbi:MAG: hypothetical protein IJZ77_03150, partial [Bacilli bacterium]|nr:hypothetical protein [Bacilli bacterium]